MQAYYLSTLKLVRRMAARRPPPPSFSATPRGRGNNSQNPNEFPFPLGWIFTRAFHFWPSLWLIYQIDSHPLLYSQMLLLLFHRRNTQFPLPRRYFYCIPIPPPPYTITIRYTLPPEKSNAISLLCPSLFHLTKLGNVCACVFVFFVFTFLCYVCLA